ncbi:bactofilin family protein [Gelidibacter mesophilus]|uniref:bactofilin family protein n=1 Tax=Gelidibacter mesophilus TaxID=169050 RepID=UPI000424CD8F|nr:polymer-forming cytoskeletal protein [Gelidibacter mesophilus]
MFAENKKGKTSAEAVNQQNTIAKGTTFTGDIISDSDFRIEGTILGNIKTPGKVVLGKTGIIKGTLEGANADIEGKFSGNLSLTDTLTLRSSAFVEGDVEVGKFSVEPGATFNATCIMKGHAKGTNNISKAPDDNATKKGQPV